MKRILLCVWLLVVVAVVMGSQEPPVGAGGVKQSTSVGGGWVNIGVGGKWTDVDLPTLGDDIIAGEYWTPAPDFARGTKYYFDPTLDPTVDARGDGTINDPFYGLGYEIYADSVIAHRDGVAGVPSNAITAVVDSNDVCVLLPGNHGKIQFNTHFFKGYLGVVGVGGPTPATFDYIKVLEGTGIYFENLTANSNLRLSGFWDAASADNYSGYAYGDTSIMGFDTAPYLVYARADTNGVGEARRLVFKDFTCIVADTATSAAWTPQEWNYNFLGGMKSYKGSYLHFQDNVFESTGVGIKCAGNSSYEASNINIIGNISNNFCGGGYATSYSDSSCFIGNESYNQYLVNKNHVDHIQGFGDSLSYGVAYTVYRGNTMFSVTDPTRLLYEHDDWIKQWDAEDIWDQVRYPGEQFGDYTGYAGSSIGLTSPQANSNLLFENNIIFSQGRVPATVFGGIKINGGSDILVTNNTVINRDDSGDAAAGYIYSIIKCTDCVFQNNIAGVVSTTGGGVGTTKSNNSEYVRDFTTAGFTTYTTDGDPTLWDLSLLVSSENVNAGLATSAPSTDYLSDCRPKGVAFDIGAYEYDDGGGCGVIFTAFSIDEVQEGAASEATFFMLTAESDSVSGSADLYDFPMLITADNFPDEVKDSDIANSLASGAAGIRFTDAYGDTLAYEVVSFEPHATPASATAEIWVLVDTLFYNSDTAIKVSYNAGDLGHPAVDATYGSEAVWADYVAVYHMNAVNPLDSGSGDHNGTEYGAGSLGTTTTGTIGTGVTFDGTNYVAVPVHADFALVGNADNITLTARINLSSATAAVASRAGTTAGDRNYYMYINGGNLAMSTGSLAATSSASYTSSWVNINGMNTLSGTSIDLFADGSVDGHSDGVGSGTIAYDFVIGGRRAASNSDIASQCTGTIDEIRLREGLRTADWFVTEDNNWDSPSTFATEGTPE